MDLDVRTPSRKAQERFGSQPQPQPLNDAAAHGEHLDFLIVEDNAVDARAVCELLDESRYRGVGLHLVNDPETAQVMVRKQHFDLVISDFWVGNKTSVSLIKEVSRQSPHLPIIMLSGFQGAGASIDESGESLFYLSKAQLSPQMLERAICVALARVAAMAGS